MHRSTGIVLAGAFIVFASETPRVSSVTEGSLETARAHFASIPSPAANAAQVSVNVNVYPGAGPLAVQDVAALLGAARGVSPIICAFAAQAVWGGGWGGWYDAPSSPIASDLTSRMRDVEREKFGPSEVRLLMDSLASGDACVRELSVRLLGRQRDEAAVISGLVERLGARAPELREVAAIGLGFLTPRTAVDPLLRALRDATPGVRANAAWALGRIDDGRALRPLIELLRDDDARVRDASAIAVGRIDSLSAVESLVRVVREDTSPQVRRSAAWALGQLEARSAVDVLIAVLRQDADARVREMAAWALGTMDTQAAAPGLIGALRRDSSDAVRETAAWALGNVGDRTAVDILGDAVRSDRSARVRGTAAWALGQLDPRDAPRGLVDGLTDQDDDVRLKAAWSLGQIGDSSAVNAIRGALRVEKSDRARKAQIRALLRSGGQSEAVLTDLLRSSDPEVREAAVRGLAGRNSFNPWPWPWPRPRPTP